MHRPWLGGVTCHCNSVTLDFGFGHFLSGGWGFSTSDILKYWNAVSKYEIAIICHASWIILIYHIPRPYKYIYYMHIWLPCNIYIYIYIYYLAILNFILYIYYIMLHGFNIECIELAGWMQPELRAECNQNDITFTVPLHVPAHHAPALKRSLVSRSTAWQQVPSTSVLDS